MNTKDLDDYAPISDEELHQISLEYQRPSQNPLTNTTDLPNSGLHLPANETEAYAQI